MLKFIAMKQRLHSMKNELLQKWIEFEDSTLTRDYQTLFYPMKCFEHIDRVLNFKISTRSIVTIWELHWKIKFSGNKVVKTNWYIKYFILSPFRLHSFRLILSVNACWLLKEYCEYIACIEKLASGPNSWAHFHLDSSNRRFRYSQCNHKFRLRFSSVTFAKLFILLNSS